VQSINHSAQVITSVEIVTVLDDVVSQEKIDPYLSWGARRNRFARS
jgi:hypothetical protein